MNSCIKCGRQIPEGELFCTECGLNPGSSLFEEPKPAPVGKMQTPKPRKSAAATTAVAEAERKTKSVSKPKANSKNKKRYVGLKIAFAVVLLLLVLVVGFLGWQYEDIRAERNRLEAKETAQQLLVSEKEDLEQQIEDLNTKLEENSLTIAEKDQEIQNLQTQLNDSASDQSQSVLDLTTAQTELARLQEDNEVLLQRETELEGEVQDLKTKLDALKPVVEKSAFMDTHVVFANDDGSYIYHTYDCDKFIKSKSFWAYNRKLAETQGFKPCATCGGKVQ